MFTLTFVQETLLHNNANALCYLKKIYEMTIVFVTAAALYIQPYVMLCYEVFVFMRKRRNACDNQWTL